MKYRLLGNSGLRVSELALGAMTFGTAGWGVEKDESRRVYDGFREAGGNFIDTANLYSGGRSETFLGEFLAGERERIVLATKYTGATRSRDVNASGNNRKNMMDAVHASLKRLQTDYIDLYWVHARDFTTPIEEVMRGLDDLVRQGKILYAGISDTPAWEVSRANMLAELRGWTAFVGLQIKYSLLDRAVERELLPMARALDIAVTPWDTLGSGILTGKYNRDAKTEGRAALRGRAISERDLAITGEVMQVAEKIGRTPAQVALNWVRQQQASRSEPKASGDHKAGVIVPLVGAKTRAQLDDNLGCLEFELAPEDLARLDAASRIELGFPHEFLQQFATSSIVNHRA
ncbi:MAG TPA: aldo/keto reductase [Myxococcota bacterium]|nr:aldo/keto reductase [Myxococcota bacterium]